jgi:hypothetical protein
MYPDTLRDRKALDQLEPEIGGGDVADDGFLVAYRAA